MLKQLDTVIGFVVVMSLVSLMITILTQIVSSLLGLRGKNLADALKAMIHKIYPKIGEQAKTRIESRRLKARSPRACGTPSIRASGIRCIR